MNKVITINLNGVAFQLEEAGYEALREYLDNAARRLEGNPDKDEIIADIEQAIADKFRALLGAHKTVVVTKEVAAVIAEMGPVQDTAADETAAGAAGATGGQQSAGGGATTGGPGGPAGIRRLYRIYPEGAMLSGVCNGLAAYFHIDATIFRIAFVVLTMLWGAGALLYVFMVLIIPLARTPEQKAAASGMAATAEEFVRRAKAGYYEGFRTFHDKEAHREWKRKFKQEMRGWKYTLQREMHENAFKWQQNWQRQWAQNPPAAWAGALPLLRWLRLLFFALLVYGAYSLFTRGAAFGLALPAGIPAWIGVIFLFVAYHILTWPIKAMRYAYFCSGVPRWGGGLIWAGPLDGLIWLCFLGALVWLADHYSPEFHAWLQNLPPAIHRFTDAVREWWARR